MILHPGSLYYIGPDDSDEPMIIGEFSGSVKIEDDRMLAHVDIIGQCYGIWAPTDNMVEVEQDRE